MICMRSSGYSLTFIQHLGTFTPQDDVEVRISVGESELKFLVEARRVVDADQPRLTNTEFRT